MDIKVVDDEDILGLPEEEKKLSTKVEHRFNVKETDYKPTGFSLSEKKEEVEEMKVEIYKPKRNVRGSKKPSNLF